MARAACPRCGRPVSTCFCASLPLAPIAHRTEVLVLQHPAEAGHAKNTAAFLTLGLQSARLLGGTIFDAAVARPDAVLLYPGESCRPLPGHVGQLILLDGNWRQSRQLLAANPWLSGLPRLALPDLPSRYAIRRAHRPGQLSTFEAGLHGLAQLEGEAGRFDPLWQAFDAFIEASLYRRATGLA